jgi:ribosomal protein S18 acetylase RimI-like enzyme
VGIGTEMMKEAEAKCRRLGIEVMTLEVFDTNERARHVYRNYGYEEVGRIPKAVSKNGGYFDLILMAKEIT